MARSTRFSRNHPTLLLIKKRRSTDPTRDLLSKNFEIFTRKHVLKQACKFIKKRLQHSSCKYWEISKNTILKNICARLLLNIFRKRLIRIFFRESPSQKHPEIPFAFKPEPSLNLTPMLYFELRFPIYIINGYDRKANVCSLWTSCHHFERAFIEEIK